MLKNTTEEDVDFAILWEIISCQPWIKEYEPELATLIKFCDNQDQKSLIKMLLENFFYFDAIKEREACIAINGVIQQWELAPKNTWIIAVANSYEVDGSNAGLQKLKNKIAPFEEWHSRFISNIPAAVEKITEGQSIVLFDDFIGTGEKMLKKKAWILKLLEQNKIDTTNINTFFIGFSGMRFGIENIGNKSGNPVFVKHSLLKGITDKISESQVQDYFNIMFSLEKKLASMYKNKRIEDYTLGFQKSESLYCGANDNCPNNVFPVFWWPVLATGKKHDTLLVRAG